MTVGEDAVLDVGDNRLRICTPCVVAYTNVLGPSDLSPRYANEFDPGLAAIDNSNVLLFNMLSEMRRGTDINGTALDGPLVRRAYVRFARFMLSTAAAPDDCDGVPCPASGEDYLRQINIRHLIKAGAFQGKKLAVLRNGGEAHQIRLESDAFDAGFKVDQFLFLPESGYVQNTAAHSGIWQRRHGDGIHGAAIHDHSVSYARPSTSAMRTYTLV